VTLLARHAIVIGKYVIYDKVPPYYNLHSYLQFFSVYVIIRRAIIDMTAMLSDLHHKDGTRRLEIRKYTCKIQYKRRRNLEIMYQHFFVHAASRL